MPSKVKTTTAKASATREAAASASASTRPGSNRVTKPAAKPAAKASARTATKVAAVKASEKPATKSSGKASAKPVAKPAAKPAAKSDTAAASKSKAAAKPSAAKSRTAASKNRKVADLPTSASEPEESKSASRKPKAAASSKKRKANDAPAAESGSESSNPLPKKAKTEQKPKASVPIGKKINSAPTQVLDVYVFGEGSAGELGLGSARVDGKKPIDVKRPRLNANLLSATSVGVVQIACGGMHAVALTRDNAILTWGVNDNGALGRDTTWDGGLRDADADDSDSDEDDSGINPLESTPTAVPAQHFGPGTKFAQVVASDSATFVLTEDGRVYGWGTFRSDDGIFGFTDKIQVQMTPILLSGLKNIKALAAGANHVLALDHKGVVLAWGSGQQNQLGRRIIERNKMSSLVPQGVGLPRGKTAKIACGAYHSFALDNDGSVWGWGLNNFGEIWAQDNVGEDNAVILRPVKVTTLNDYKIADIDGGVHHSVACSDAGDLLTWGRVDGYQVGFEIDSLDKKDVIFDERDNPRILVNPAKHQDLPAIASVAAGTDNSFAVSRDGKVYSWGFSANYQTGQGTIDDIHTPTLIDNSAIRDKAILAAYAGGQFSVLVGAADDASEVKAPETNGVNGH